MRILISIFLSIIVLSVAFQSSMTRALISWNEDSIIALNQWTNLPPPALECAVNCFTQKTIADNNNPDLPGISIDSEKQTFLISPDRESVELPEMVVNTSKKSFLYSSRFSQDFLDIIFHPPRTA